MHPAPIKAASEAPVLINTRRLGESGWPGCGRLLMVRLLWVRRFAGMGAFYHENGRLAFPESILP